MRGDDSDGVVGGRDDVLAGGVAVFHVGAAGFFVVGIGHGGVVLLV